MHDRPRERQYSHIDSRDVATVTSQLDGVSISSCSSHHDGLLGHWFHQHRTPFNATLSDPLLASISAQELQRRATVPENVSDNASEVDIDGAV